MKCSCQTKCWHQMSCGVKAMASFSGSLWHQLLGPLWLGVWWDDGGRGPKHLRVEHHWRGVFPDPAASHQGAWNAQDLHQADRQHQRHQGDHQRWLLLLPAGAGQRSQCDGHPEWTFARALHSGNHPGWWQWAAGRAGGRSVRAETGSCQRGPASLWPRQLQGRGKLWHLGCGEAGDPHTLHERDDSHDGVREGRLWPCGGEAGLVGRASLQCCHLWRFVLCSDSGWCHSPLQQVQGVGGRGHEGWGTGAQPIPVCRHAAQHLLPALTGVGGRGHEGWGTRAQPIPVCHHVAQHLLPALTGVGGHGHEGWESRAKPIPVCHHAAQHLLPALTAVRQCRSWRFFAGVIWGCLIQEMHEGLPVWCMLCDFEIFDSWEAWDIACMMCLCDLGMFYVWEA